jgi:integrase
MALTTKRIAKLKQPGRYGDGHGLYLQVLSPTNRSWCFRYDRGGRGERWMGLGALHTIDLKEARERARKARQQLLDGIDPLDARKAERNQRALEAAKAITFEEAAQQYFAQHEQTWTNAKHRKQFLTSLRAHVFPTIGKLPVAEIDTGLVLKCIEPIWYEKTATANRTRGRVESVLDWATVRGYRRAGDNPARWQGHLSEVLPARGQLQKIPKHHAALDFAELPAFMVELRKREGVAARALEFLILNASRTGEILFAVWDEIDFDNQTWTIPASRMKASKEHRMPLSPPAIEILRTLPREEDNRHIFVGARQAGLSHSAFARLLISMGRAVTAHGFRATFKTWASERTNFANEIVEAALAHTIGSAVERAYRRGTMFDRRRKLMEAWASYCSEAPAAANAVVVPLRKT